MGGRRVPAQASASGRRARRSSGITASRRRVPLPWCPAAVEPGRRAAEDRTRLVSPKKPRGGGSRSGSVRAARCGVSAAVAMQWRTA